MDFCCCCWPLRKISLALGLGPGEDPPPSPRWLRFTWSADRLDQLMARLADLRLMSATNSVKKSLKTAVIILVVIHFVNDLNLRHELAIRFISSYLSLRIFSNIWLR